MTARALYFVNHPGLSKARSLIGHLQERAIRDPALIAAILFLADGEHLYAYGRGLYGETWYRATETGLETVRGTHLDALFHHREPGKPGFRFDRDAVSRSDLEVVASAVDGLQACVAGLGAASGFVESKPWLARLADAVRAGRLWQDGPAGAPLDLLTPVRARFGDDAEGVEDQAFVIRHGSY